jgi:hypothetical protein
VLVRFLSNLAVLLAGALLLAASLSFAAATTSWLGLGAACAVLVIVLAALPVRGRGPVQRCFDLIVLAVAAWSVVAARAFAADTARWLMFASAWAWLAAGALAQAIAALELARALRRLAPVGGSAAGAPAAEGHPESRARVGTNAHPGARSRR